MLADKLPELEKLCPDIAKSVKGFVSPAPAAPAAALHSAQSTCQIAFKDLQAAETQVSEYESECSELVAELRRKISQLNTAQLELTSARAKYDEAATAVQLEVKKHTKVEGNDEVHKLEQQWILESDPDKLDAIANKLAAAAAEARQKQQYQAGQAAEAAAAAAKATFEFGAPTTSPAEVVAVATLPLAATQPLEQALPDTSPTQPAASEAVAAVAILPGSLPLSSAAAAEEAAARLAALAPTREPAKDKKRESSRSPRRTKSSDNGSDMQDDAADPDPSKSQKTKSNQSARSAGGSLDVDGAVAANTPQHFEKIADGLEAQLLAAGVSAHCS